MSDYLVVSPLTTTVLGASWSTDLLTMQSRAVKLGGVAVNRGFLHKHGIATAICDGPFPRKLLIGVGASAIALTEEKRAPWGGNVKSAKTISALRYQNPERDRERSAETRKRKAKV